MGQLRSAYVHRFAHIVQAGPVDTSLEHQLGRARHNAPTRDQTLLGESRLAVVFAITDVPCPPTPGSPRFARNSFVGVGGEGPQIVDDESRSIREWPILPVGEAK